MQFQLTLSGAEQIRAGCLAAWLNDPTRRESRIRD